MSEGLPIIIITIALLLLLMAVALIALRKGGKLKQPRNKKIFLPLFILGLILSLAGAFLMFNGDILGENTTGIATVIGIVGIGLIATSNVTLIVLNRKK